MGERAFAELVVDGGQNGQRRRPEDERGSVSAHAGLGVSSHQFLWACFTGTMSIDISIPRFVVGEVNGNVAARKLNFLFIFSQV